MLRDDIAPKDRAIQTHHALDLDSSFRLVWVNCTRPNGVSAIGRPCPEAGVPAGNRTAKL